MHRNALPAYATRSAPKASRYSRQLRPQLVLVVDEQRRAVLVGQRVEVEPPTEPPASSTGAVLGTAQLADRRSLDRSSSSLVERAISSGACTPRIASAFGQPDAARLGEPQPRPG